MYEILNVQNRVAEVANKKFKSERWKPNQSALIQLNMKKSRFNSIYNNKVQPNLTELFLIADLLNVSTDKLIQPIFKTTQKEKVIIRSKLTSKYF